MKDTLDRDAEVRGDSQSRLVLEQWERVKRARLNVSAVDDASATPSSPAETLAEREFQAISENAISKWRHFFKVDPTNFNRRVCIMKPDFGSMSSPPNECD